jgi:hypothetical protein
MEHASDAAGQPAGAAEDLKPCTHLTLRLIDEDQWCALDPRFPHDDARCLVGFVERLGAMFHAIRLDSSPIESFEERDLDTIVHDLEDATHHHHAS